MCGILGFVGPALPDATSFERALDTLARRGPDDAGVFSEPQALLGHRRLAILDLSREGHQPMRSADGRFVIVFNGEVYNFQALRAELEAVGQPLRSTSDTEVILELYAREGPACVRRFRGMFALAIWDLERKELFLARDRLGIKPLYIARRGQALAFASELKALRALGFSEVNGDALRAFLTWGNVPAPDTALRGVTCFPAGSWARFVDGELETHTYWDIPTDVGHQSREEVLEALRPALRESVALRCIADVPVGAFLSGGIDSSAVVSLMRAVGQRDLRTFSITFPGSDLDESGYAAQIARVFETHHTAAAVDSALVRDALDDFFTVLDQPTCDGVNTYLVSRFAKEAGLTVALSGLGGDELFAGYPSFKRAQRLGPLLAATPARLRSAAGAALSRVHPRLAKLESFQVPGAAMPQMYLASRGLFTPSQVAALLSPELAAERQAAVDERELLPTLPLTHSAFHDTMRLELRRYMHDQLLRDSDVFGMAHALEIRVPLIDHEVVEIVARAPAHVVVQGEQKALLRDALPTALPRACTDRRKMGFTFPFAAWMKGSLRPMIEDGLLSTDPSGVLSTAAVREVWQGFLAGQVHWSRPWSLYVLRRWAGQITASKV
jgi:asparagine synthase (glutamine-hydrolysing)